MKITKALLFCAIIALSSCEKDLYENLELETKTPFEIKFLNAEQLPADFQNYINQKGTNVTARSSSDSDDFSNAIYSPYDIISMTDDKNIINYSISFFYEDTPKNVFYNLIINVSPTGQSSKNIFKYICNPADFENFKSHNFDFKYFVGMTEISTVVNNSNKKLTSKSNSEDDPCPKIHIPSSSDLESNSSGGGTGDSPTSGGFNTSVPGYNAPGYTGSNSPGPSTGSDGHDHSGCYGSNGQYWYYGGDVRPPHSHTGKMASDCPEVVPPTGYVPVNTTAAILADLKTWIVLDRFQLLFLTANPDILNLVCTYLYNTGANEEDRAFAVAMVNAARIEKQIDHTQLDPCPKEIMEQLKKATNSDIANVLTKLGASSIYNLTMKMGVMKYPQDFAETQKISKNNYLITVTQDTYTTATKLYKATALLHEMIHAYMLSVVDDYNTYPTNDPFADFPTLFKLYVERNFPSGALVAQHEDMANRYVDAIASALEEYQLNTGGPNSAADKQAFQDMAWSGLQGTNIFDKKYPIGSADKNRLDGRIRAEQSGGYSTGQYPIGKPCN